MRLPAPTAATTSHRQPAAHEAATAALSNRQHSCRRLPLATYAFTPHSPRAALITPETDHELLTPQGSPRLTDA